MPNQMKQWSTEYLANDQRYSNHVHKFINYLEQYTELSNSPTAISQEILVADIQHYVRNGSIASAETLYLHLESIKAFYRYLIGQHYYHENLIPDVGYAEFKDDLVARFNLPEAIERTWIPDDDIIQILTKFDDYFENTIYEELRPRDKNWYTHMLCLRVYIKLCLVAPAKKGVIIDLKKSDFEDCYRRLFINEVWIKIPNSLRRDIGDAVGFIGDHYAAPFENNTRLIHYLSKGIVGSDSDPTGTNLNTWFCRFLKKNYLLDIPAEANSYSVELLSNSTIHNMILAGTNPYFIAKISGVSISTLEEKYYSKIDRIDFANDLNSNIFTSISRCDYYNYI